MLTIIVGAIAVGMILGLLGSGGSALVVPILVYLVGHHAKTSIAESMAIVGAISLAGAIPYALGRQVDWRSVILFGLPAMAGTLGGAWLGGMAADAVQLIVFGIVLILAAGFMIKKAFGREPEKVDQSDTTNNQNSSPRESSLLAEVLSPKSLLIIAEGIAVGALTGFVGVGGGFLIVPALLILGNLSMRTAIGTSLVIIVLKSIVGFIKYQGTLVEMNLHVDWWTIAIFSGIGVLGCLVGQNLNSRLNQRALKQMFSIFLILIGLFVIGRESLALFSE